MGIQRANPLYPVNTTVVDSGTGIDIRLLDSVEAGADDTTQTANFTHSNDNVERTFDPATGGVINTNNAGTTLFKTGWALRLSQDMTPGDDTNCDTVLTSGTLTVSLRVNATQTGGTYLTAQTYAPTFRASLWKYNPTTDTGSLIAAGSTTATTWQTNGLGVAKTASISINIASNVTFSQGGTAAEILLLQIGFNTGTVPNPLGTANWVQTLIVDNANTNITFGSGQGIVQFCSFANNLTGTGTASSRRGVTPVPYTLITKGSLVYSKIATVSKTFALNAVATASRTGLLVLALPRNLIATGTTAYLRQVTALRNFGLTARGTVTSNRTVSLGRIATGIGTATYLKQVTASKSFNLTGAGTPYYSKFTIANREFTVVGQGKIVMTGPNASTIAMPIDDIPDGGAPSATYIFPVLD